jgi:DNA polymerase-1
VELAQQLQTKMQHQEKELLMAIKKESGTDIDIWAARQVAIAFDKLKIDYPRTEKTNEPSFTQNWLVNCKHKIAQLIVQTREINKFHNTFLSSIMKYQVKGRIHAEIRQLKGESGGTVTGRLSMSNPNLQQVPARNKEIGPLIRSLFLPEEGELWCSKIRKVHCIKYFC